MATEGGDRSFGAPRFDIVLRGYDRRQVDEHLSRLQRVLSRMRGDLEAARGRGGAPMPPPGPPLPGLRPRPTPRRRPDGPPGAEGADVVGTFTERMQIILQSAEDEAAEIVTKARAEADRVASSQVDVRVAEEQVRATLNDLVRQRDAVLADLTRVRGQLEALLSAPTARIPVHQPEATTATSAAVARRDAGAGHPLPGTPASPAGIGQVGAGQVGAAQVALVAGEGPPERGTPEPGTAETGGAERGTPEPVASGTAAPQPAAPEPATPTNGAAHSNGPHHDGPHREGPHHDGPRTGSPSTGSPSTGSPSAGAGRDAVVSDGPSGSEDTVQVGAAGGATSSS